MNHQGFQGARSAAHSKLLKGEDNYDAFNKDFFIEKIKNKTCVISP